MVEYWRKVFGLLGLVINWGFIFGVGVMIWDSYVVKLMIMGGLGFIYVKDGKLKLSKILSYNI